ncbi:MAG: putative Haloacid dehalogenase superfamily hydrolase, subfamily IB, PSPase-like [Nitrospira sp.]
MTPAHMLSRSGTGTQVAAFFDLDNTLLPGEASEVRFFRFLWRRKVVGWPELKASVGWLLRHSPAMSLQPLREHKLYLAGKPAQVIEPLGEEFCREELCPVVAADGMRRMEEHRRAGHRIVLITGSLHFLVQPIAEALRVDRSVAAVLEQAEGLCTGRLVAPLPYGEEKRALIQRLSAELDFDLGSCFAYVDSPGDLEILKAVGHPTVVNPIRGMGTLAVQYHWPIVRWR